MDVSESLATGLGAVGNETALPEAAFAELLRLASQDAVTDERAGQGRRRTPFDGRPDLAQAKGLASVNAATVKEAHAALLGFILEAARFDVDPAAVGPLLEENKLSAGRAQAVAKAYAAVRSAVRAQLARTAYTYPHITGVKWRLDYYVKNNHVDKVNKPVYLVSLQTDVPNGAGATKEVQFTCTVEQLQDLVDHLKDAAKAVQSIGQ